MGRKVIAIIAALTLLLGSAVGAHAAEVAVYDGNLSATLVACARDIVSGMSYADHYLFARIDEYTYHLYVGDITYEGGIFSINSGKLYRIITGSDNTAYTYEVAELAPATITPGMIMVYSDLGDYPQLITMEGKNEIIQTFLFFTALLGVCVFRFLRRS